MTTETTKPSLSTRFLSLVERVGNKLPDPAVLFIGLLAILLAIAFPERIFTRVLFAWQALAAAFGPLLVVTLWRGPVRPGWRIAALVTGFALTVVLSWAVDSPGDWVERLVPLALALALAVRGSGRGNR